MRPNILTLVIGILILAYAPSASARKVNGDVLGLRTDMSRENVHRRLQKIGRLERAERGRQEVWKLEGDARFGAVLVGFDPTFKLRYVTAIVREGGKRMRYSEVGDIKKAQPENIMGNYRYTWEIKARGKKPGYFLIALGRDPEYLTSVSIKKKKDDGVD